jgi:hypothetical protein
MINAKQKTYDLHGHVTPRHCDLAGWSAAHKLFQNTHPLITSGSFGKSTNHI